jgi:type II secretory pathway component GspD/PulD (secretin)
MSTLVTETIPLSCLSPQQAAEIVDPYLRTHGSLYFVPTSGISAITVRGTAAQLNKSKDLIRDFESDRAAACRNTLPGSNKVPTAAAERPEPKRRPEPKQ